MMVRSRQRFWAVWLTLLFTACWPISTCGARLVGFNPAESLDLATDIVQVEPVEKEPGSLRVVSVWRGTLNEGFVFDASEIDLKIPWAKMDKRPVPMADQPEDMLEPTSYVLFLRDTQVVKDKRLEALPKDEMPPLWTPAHSTYVKHYGISTLYIEGGRAYGLAQAWGNPGPLVPVYHCTAAKWHRRVKAYDDLEQWLEQAESERAVDELAEIYADAVDQRFSALVERVREALKAIGTEAIKPIQRTMLHSFGTYGGRTDDWKFRTHRPLVFNLLAEIDKEEAQPIFRLQAQYSLYHFQRALKNDLDLWMNSSNFASNNRQEYAILATVLTHIDPPTNENDLELMKSIRELWRDERLNLKKSHRYMSLDIAEICDELIQSADLEASD